MVTRYINDMTGRSYLNDPPVETKRRGKTAEEVREALRLAREDMARDTATAPEPASPAPPRREEKAASKEQAASPERPASRPVSHEQRCAERVLFRYACNWFELHHLCANERCHRAKSCRGEAVACLRVGIQQVPESARQFVRSMIEGKELGFDFDQALEGTEELQESWAAWIAGLEAASKARNRVKKARR